MVGKRGCPEKIVLPGSGAQVWHLNVHYSPFFNGFCGCFAGSAERGRWEGAASRAGASCTRRRPPLPTQEGGGGGGLFFLRIPSWHAYLTPFSRVRAAMRTATGARKVVPDDTDELRE
eukprot:gene18407-biopygen21951